MNPLPEQFSSAGKTQLLAQLDFFGTLAAAAIDNTRRLADMQLQASRASIEHSASTVRQLIDARAASDLFRLAPVARENFDTMLALGREMFSIASGAALRAGQHGVGGAPGTQPSAAPASTAEAPARTTLSDAVLPDPAQERSSAAARADAAAAFGSTGSDAASRQEELLDDNRALPVVEEVAPPPGERSPIAQAAADLAQAEAPTIAAAGMGEEAEQAASGKSGARKLGKKH